MRTLERVALVVSALCAVGVVIVDLRDAAAAAPPTPAPMYAATSTPAVYVARDAASLRAAAQASWTRDVVVLVEGEIPWTGSSWDYRFGRPGGWVQIRGPGTLDFSAYRSTWPDAYDANGVMVIGAEADVSALVISGYNGTGSALKFDVSGSWRVDSCRFYRCGDVVLPVRADGTAGYTNAIGSHGQAHRIEVVNSTFEKCALNDEQLAHVLYVSAKLSILVSGNQYSGCGSVWACYSPRTVIAWDMADAGLEAATWDRRRKEFVHPWMLVHNGGRLAFLNNTVVGTVDHVFHGYPPFGGVLAGNVYTCTARAWAFQWNVGDRDRAWWMAQGFER